MLFFLFVLGSRTTNKEQRQESQKFNSLESRNETSDFPVDGDGDGDVDGVVVSLLSKSAASQVFPEDASQRGKTHVEFIEKTWRGAVLLLYVYFFFVC